MTRLRDIVAVQGGGTPRRSTPEFYGGSIPWVTPKDMKRPIVHDSSVRLTQAGMDRSPAKLIAPGSVLVVVRSGVLKHTLPVALTTAPVTVNQDMKALTPSDAVHPAFLARLIKSLQPRVLSWVRATTADNFPIENLLELDVEIPPLSEQRRIAAILDQADALRAKRRQALAHLDDLSRSVFHSMFGSIGDPRWERLPLGDVVSAIDSGTSPNCEARAASDEEVGILKLGAVTYGVFRAHENKAYLDDVGTMRSNEVRPGDVLMTRKNTRELVGAVALVDEVRPNLLLPDLIFRLTLDETRIDRRYFQALMMNPGKRPSVRDLSSGSAASMPNISKARLRQLALELPPLDMQRKFAARVEKINSQRATMQKCVEAEEELFSSLQHHAFRGDL